MGTKILVPLMDLCNHSADANCEPRGVLGGPDKNILHGVSMVAKKAIKRGEAITSNYGTMDSITWFQKFGMICKGNLSHDSVVQYIDLPKEPTALFEEKTSYYPQMQETKRTFSLN